VTRVLMGHGTNPDFQNWGEDVKDQVLSMLLGPCLAVGVGRAVFEVNGNPTMVVKVEDVSQSFQNVIEWEFWNTFRKEPIRKWLAPCLAISNQGRVLLQARTSPLRHGDRVRVPEYFSDLKCGNFGYLGTRVVCHDYGLLSGDTLRRGQRHKLVFLES